MIEALVHLLIVVLIVGLIAWLVIFVIDLLPIEGPFKQIARVLVLVIALLIVLLRTLPLLGVASAHDAPTGWKYPWACCSNMDCQEISSKQIKEEPRGYVLTDTGEVISYRDKRVRDSPDGEFHWCAHQAGIDAGHTICLFVPPKGF